MSAIANIKEYLEKLPEGEPFSSNVLRHYASTENIRQILNRLVKAGEIKRVAWGIFVKSKVDLQPPSILEITKTLTQSTGETIMVHGAEAARELELSTQVPMRLVFYTNGNTRTLKIGSRRVKLKHVNPSRFIAPGTTEGLVISALRYLGRREVSMETVAQIKEKISLEAFNKTLALMDQMPGWMSDIFYRYQQENNNE